MQKEANDISKVEKKTSSTKSFAKARKQAEKQLIRYTLIDQRRYNFLCFKDEITDMCLVIHATNLASNPELISQFSAKDACKIGVVAGLACNEPPPPANFCEELNIE